MRIGRVLSVLVAAVGVAALAACASSGGSGGEGRRFNANELTPEEIAEAPVSNLYEAVERFRPRWLLIRSQRSLNLRTEIAVFLNSSYLGTPESLRQVGLAGLVRMRYLDAARATALYQVPDGTAIEGAIVVEVGRDD